MTERNGQKVKEMQLSEGLDSDKLEESEIEEVLDNIPEEHRKTFERLMISSSIQMRSVSSPETVVMKKLTTEHITKYLDGAREEMQNSYTEKLHKKRFTFVSMVFAMIFFLIIILLLRETPDVMEKIIYAVGGVVVGAFGGYGIGKRKNDE